MAVSGLRRGFYGLSKITSTTNASSFKYSHRRALSDLKKNIYDDDSILPVLIVGAGPVGLVLSILLTNLGVKCSILEKNTIFSRHPQAHFINNRSMEVFRKLDGSADDIMNLQPPVDYWRKFIYCTSLTGQILGSVDHMQPQDFDRTVSPVSVAHFSQYKLNRLLLEKLVNLGFHVVDCKDLESLNQVVVKDRQIFMGHECVSVKTADHGVTVTASFLREGRYMEKDIHCNFLVGTDGAGSTVRKLVGIDMKGERDLQKLVSVHFFSQDLGKYLMKERAGMLFFIFNSEAIGVLVAHDLKQGEFVLQVPFYPPQQKLEDFSSEMCERLIFKLVGRELADIDVMDVKPWVMHAEVAEKFLSCNNRVILAGDAAHRFPPAGGFGMNSGVQDAHNLAWKIASVLYGITRASFLSTYEMERKQIASFNTELSVQNFKSAMAVLAALGLDPTIANAVHRAINDTVGTILPHGLQRLILDGIFSIGRSQLSESVLNDKNPLGSLRLAKLRQIFDEGKSLQLQFPAEDLGFRYLKGALVSDGDSFLNAPEAPTGRRRDYIPSADPGSRLPHMNIRLLSSKDHRKGQQNMFRPLLSSVPSSTFYVGKSSAAHRTIISRHSSVATSSNASSDLGTSGAHDTEGSQHNQEDITSECIKEPYYEMQEELFGFDKADSINEKSVDRNHEKLPDCHDEYDGHPRLDSQVVGDESSSQHDTAIAISVTSEILDVKGDFSDADSFEDVLLCSRCGHRYHTIEEIDHDLKLCTDCRSAEIYSVVTTSPKSMMVCKNSPGKTVADCHSEPNRNLLPESTGAQGEQIFVSQQVGNQPTLSSSTAPYGEIDDHQLQNTSGYSNSRADDSEGAGISLLLTSSSGKGPIVSSRTFTATSISCDDFSYVRNSATSTRSSFGHGTASGSSSVDLGSGRQMDARGQRQISRRKSDTENYRHEMYIKHQRSVSSLSGTSTHGFQTSSLATSSHEESLDVFAVHVEKDNLQVTPVALRDLSLASGSMELDNVSTDIESDNNWRTVSELSSHTTNIHLGNISMASVSNIEEPALPEYVEDLANESCSGIDTDASCSHLETCACEEDATSNASTDRVDVAEAPNLSSLDVISELESENNLVVSPDSVLDIDSQNSKSSMDDLQDPSPVASSNDIEASTEDLINQDHVHSILEESTLMLESQVAIHTRSLTLEEATDTILFCSSIVHNLAYDAANIAIEKENSAPLEGSQPVLTVVGKSNPDRRDSRARTVSKRNAKFQKARQRRLETDSKPPPGNSATDEKRDVTTRIIGAPNKGDSMKPPKLESKCNCAIM